MLISCRDLAERASAYLDRDLPWWRRLEVRLHLFVCENCRRYLDQLRAAAALARQSLARDAAMPAASEERLLAAIRARAVPHRDE